MERQIKKYDFESFFGNAKFDTITVSKGDFLFREGDREDYVYYIRKGEMMVVQNDWILWLAREQELIGMYSYFSGTRKFRFSAFASQDSEIYAIPTTVFTQLLKENPVFYRSIVRMLTNRIEYTNQRILNLRGHSSRIRLIKELIFLVKENRDRSKTINLNLEDLSKVVGVSKRVLRGIMEDLAMKKMLEYNKSNIRILDMRGLEILAE